MLSIAHLYVTRHCPYSCSYCGVKDNAKEGLPIEKWIGIVDRLFPLVKEFNVIGGEPLVKEGIWGLLRHLVKAGKFFTVSTALTTRKNLAMLRNIGVSSISVSLDAMDGWLEGTKGKSINALTAMELWRGKGPNFCGVVVSPWNVDKVIPVVEFASGRGFYCCVNPVNVNSSDTEFGGKRGIPGALYLGKLGYLAEVLIERDDLLLADPPEYYQEWKRLPDLWKCSSVHSIAVDSDGSLSPCISLYKPRNKYMVENLDQFLKDYTSLIFQCSGCMMDCSWTADMVPEEIL